MLGDRTPVALFVCLLAWLLGFTYLGIEPGSHTHGQAPCHWATAPPSLIAFQHDRLTVKWTSFNPVVWKQRTVVKTSSTDKLAALSPPLPRPLLGCLCWWLWLVPLFSSSSVCGGFSLGLEHGAVGGSWTWGCQDICTYFLSSSLSVLFSAVTAIVVTTSYLLFNMIYGVSSDLYKTALNFMWHNVEYVCANNIF